MGKTLVYKDISVQQIRSAREVVKALMEGIKTAESAYDRKVCVFALSSITDEIDSSLLD